VDQVLPGFRSTFGVIVAPLNADRIGMSFVDDTFVLRFDSPEYETVRWTGNYNGSTGFQALKNAIYQILLLDPDQLKNQDIFDPEYNATNREVIIYFRGKAV